MKCGKSATFRKPAPALPGPEGSSRTDLPGSHPRIATVILAAGESRRLRTPMALLRWRERTLLDHVVSQTEGIASAKLFVVLGPQAGEIERVCSLGKARIVMNDRWREGMSSSIRAGIQAVEKSPVPFDAALVLVADQPALTSDHLGTVIERYGRNGCELVASCYSGRIGLPALFDRSWFSELTRLKADQGAESILQNGHGRCCVVPFPGGAFDIENPGDAEQLRGWDPLEQTGTFLLGQP